MNRSDTLRRISAISRADHGACLWALGYMSLDLPQSTLADLLAGLEEFVKAHPTPMLGTHLELVRERFSSLKP